jgi:hypothetical protein
MIFAREMPILLNEDTYQFVLISKDFFRVEWLEEVNKSDQSQYISQFCKYFVSLQFLSRIEVTDGD